MRLFGDSYSRECFDYVCVDPLVNILKLDFVTEHFGYLLKENNLKKIRFHDLRHPYVKLKLKIFLTYFADISIQKSLIFHTISIRLSG